MSLLDKVVAFCKVLGSSVLGRNSTVAYHLTAGGGFSADGTSEDASDDAGEQAHDQPTYSALGFLARPLDPSSEGYCEAAALRTSDGLESIGVRDPRLSRAADPLGAGVPAKGQQVIVGYGGAVISLTMTPAASGSRKANVLTLYVPHDFDGDGVAQKSHTLVIDPEQGIQLIHSSGAVLQLCNDVGNGEPGINWAVSDESFGRISAAEAVIQAPKIMLKGNVYLGASAETGLPLLAGPASPPSPSVFVSPV